ncbi:MAG: Cytochrome c4 [SAR92 bacterium MED-G29]|jgi:cytochrome c553|nr:cytochrome c4 [Porticoccaceae bacterium]CAI8347090.1 MAG: Cytochrome c4 [SAR92 bacterium MED-G29]|tara:strand:+ start:11656 stop:12297 length:642 start_codon:yes stop_codon:yes gene_type:complete
MKKSFLSIICLLTAFSANHALAVGDASAGESKVAMCAGCHGSDGNSMVASFPNLAGIGEKYMTQQLRTIKSGDRVIVEMTGILNASTDQDLQDMAAYYDSQTRKITGAQDITLVGISDPDEALDYGENVYRGGNMKTGVAACTGCHSPAGNGNNPAGYPALGGQYADYIEKQLLAYRRGERASGGNAAIMQGVAANLSDKEIKAVANYISGLN